MRLLLSVLLIAPPAFLMGFPMATGMNWLARLDKEHMFVWAWGINGCFSVIGAAAVPLIATTFGLDRTFEFSAAVYLLAAPAFLVFSAAVGLKGAKAGRSAGFGSRRNSAG